MTGPWNNWVPGGVVPTVHLENTHELDFKTLKFPHHVINGRYHIDEENSYMQKICMLYSG